MKTRVCNECRVEIAPPGCAKCAACYADYLHKYPKTSAVPLPVYYETSSLEAALEHIEKLEERVQHLEAIAHAHGRTP